MSSENKGPSAPSAADFVPPVKPFRRHSIDVASSGWLSGLVRRPSVDLSVFQPPDPSKDAPSGTQAVDNLTVSRQNTETVKTQPESLPISSDTNRGLGQRRKSESMLWKWFNTPMTQGDILTSKITEADESVATTTTVSQIAQQMAPQVDSQNLVTLDPSNFSALKMTKRVSSARDLNALSPSNW